MSEGPGESSIKAIWDIAWGAHFCQFYRTKEDLMDILIPYFKAGLENNEFCIWIIPEFFKIKEEAIGNLRKAIPQFDTYLEKEQIEIIPCTDLYMKEGIFDSEEALNYWIRKVNQSLNNGYNGLRLTEEFSWLKEDLKNLIDYEEQFDSVIGINKIKALCTYSLDQCDITDVIDLIMNHQFSMVKREGRWEKMENPIHKKVEERVTRAVKRIGSKSKEAPDNLEKLLEERTAQLKKAYESLKEREKCLSQIQKMSHIGNWKWNIVTGELHWSNEVYRIFGCNPKEFSPTYDAYLSYVHPDDRDYLINAIKKGFDGNLQNIDYRIIRPDGEERAVHTQAEIILDEKNIPVWAEGIIQDITERKQVEEAHRRSEERYRMLFTNMSEAFFLGEIIYNRNGKPYDYRFLEINPVFESHSGVKGEQVLGKSHLEVFHKANPTVIKKYGEVALSGTPTHFEFFTQLTSRYLDIYVFSPERGKFAAIFRDITERKQLDEQIRQRAEEIETVMEVVPVAIWIGHDPQCHNITGNRMANEFYEAEVGENVSANVTPVRRFFHKGRELTADELPMQKAAFKDIDMRNEEIDVLLPSGEWRGILGSASPLHDAQGNVRGSVGAFVDITKRKKAEAKLKETLDNLENLVKERTTELQKAEERYRVIAEQTGQLVYDYNVEEDTADWAGNIKEITGYTSDKFRNMSVQFLLSRIHPEDRKTFLKSYERFLTYGGTYRSEYRFRKENGEYIYLEDHGVCLKDEKDKVKRILGTTKDITERKKAEKALANIETARKREIHHRIKNNLQVISSLLDLQAEKFRDRKHTEDSDVLAAFKESQDRVLSIALIHEELHEGKGTDKLNFCPYLEKLVENLFETYRVGNVDLSLNMNLEENIFFDTDVAVPLGLIINEIVSNSLKYAFTGRDKGIIRIKLCREENGESASSISGRKGEDYKSKTTSFSLTISDNGVGLPDNFNLEDSDTLGLQLISILVDQLEGKLELKTDSGTEFIIRFTIRDEE